MSKQVQAPHYISRVGKNCNLCKVNFHKFPPEYLEYAFKQDGKKMMYSTPTHTFIITFKSDVYYEAKSGINEIAVINRIINEHVANYMGKLIFTPKNKTDNTQTPQNTNNIQQNDILMQFYNNNQEMFVEAIKCLPQEDKMKFMKQIINLM